MKALLIKNGIVDDIHVFDELPEGYSVDPGGVGIGWSDNGDGTFSAPPQPVYTPTNKEVRDKALRELEYDFGDGRVIQTRPQDELNVRTAIQVMTDNAITSRNWVMKDNVKHPVTIAELETAMAAGQLAAVIIWDNYEPE